MVVGVVAQGIEDHALVQLADIAARGLGAVKIPPHGCDDVGVGGMRLRPCGAQ